MREFWYFNTDHPFPSINPLDNDEEYVRDKAERSPWLIIFESTRQEINDAEKAHRKAAMDV